MILTKVIATLGPACNTAAGIERLMEEGVDVCRLNFSHGSEADHAQLLSHVRQASERFDHPISVLGDLCGPKIRVGEVLDDGSGGMRIATGASFIVHRDHHLGAHGQVGINEPSVIDDVKVGQRLLIDDGQLRFLVTHKGPDELGCQCTSGGIIRSHKGVNLPDTDLELPAITPRDWRWVDWAIDNQIDYLALSFVRTAEELHELRRYVEGKGSDIHLIGKIEKPQALEHIDAIIHAADGLMVARGDLGVEMDLAQVPIIQKDVVQRSHEAGKPVIIATQMLGSMVDESSPTRAEVSDVANAIYDRTDAVMLSGETAVGRQPALAVHTMNHILEVTEDYLTRTADLRPETISAVELGREYAAIARGVWQIARELKVKLVAVWSQSGRMARVFSKLRFVVPVLCLTSDQRAIRRMGLHFGLIAHEMPIPPDANAMIEEVDRLGIERGLVAEGDRIIVVASTTLGKPGRANGVFIHEVGTL
jgi:pyruvate kinase